MSVFYSHPRVPLLLFCRLCTAQNNVCGLAHRGAPVLLLFLLLLLNFSRLIFVFSTAKMSPLLWFIFRENGRRVTKEEKVKAG